MWRSRQATIRDLCSLDPTRIGGFHPDAQLDPKKILAGRRRTRGNHTCAGGGARHTLSG